MFLNPSLPTIRFSPHAIFFQARDGRVQRSARLLHLPSIHAAAEHEDHHQEAPGGLGTGALLPGRRPSAQLLLPEDGHHVAAFGGVVAAASPQETAVLRAGEAERSRRARVAGQGDRGSEQQWDGLCDWAGVRSGSFFRVTPMMLQLPKFVIGVLF